MSELEKSSRPRAKDKAAHREAVQAYKAAEKYARDASRAEADQWAENAKKQAGSPKAQRDMLKAALRARSTASWRLHLPKSALAWVGIKLAGLATDEAMLAEIERRIDKLNVELEKHLKKRPSPKSPSCSKKAQPDMEAGKKGKGARMRICTRCLQQRRRLPTWTRWPWLVVWLTSTPALHRAN